MGIKMNFSQSVGGQVNSSEGELVYKIEVFEDDEELAGRVG